MQLLALLTILAQNVSVGVVAGTNATDGFPQYSNSRNLIAGFMVEWKFLEVDGLYRVLRQGGPYTNNIVTWEFPVLAKYRLAFRPLTPFLEAGPSFRTAGNLSGPAPGHFGFTAGAGVEKRLAGFTVAPQIRYTRWDGKNLVNEPSKNQVELLVGFSRGSSFDAHPLGTRFSVGVVAGTNLTNDFRSDTTRLIFVYPDGTQLSGTDSFSPGPRSLIVGPMVELELPHRLSVEVDALYRPLRSQNLAIFQNVPVSAPSSSRVITWEFPVLAKYRFDVPIMKPLLEAGPSFRTPQEVNGGRLATYGATAGVGVETQLRRLKIGPVVRYTHWASDRPREFSKTIRSQVEFLVGFSL